MEVKLTLDRKAENASPRAKPTYIQVALLHRCGAVEPRDPDSHVWTFSQLVGSFRQHPETPVLEWGRSCPTKGERPPLPLLGAGRGLVCHPSNHLVQLCVIVQEKRHELEPARPVL